MSLTVLSFSAGQDSKTILKRLHHDAKERKKYAPGDYLVVMSDTGDEHPETYKEVRDTEVWCKMNEIEFHLLTKDKGYHTPAWPSLREFYNRTNTVGSKCFPKTCTDKLKIQPIYKFLSEWVGKKYGLKTNGKYRGKQPLVEHAEQIGKIDMLIGIASDEAKKRIGGADHGAKWMQLSINRRYPLVDWGWDRAACQAYLKSIDETIPLPSNCLLCPFMNLTELLWLFTFYPDSYHDWVRIEKNKIDANTHKGDKNYGVFGKMLLPEALSQAKEKHGHMTKAELQEHKMSHGHCVASKY